MKNPRITVRKDGFIFSTKRAYTSILNKFEFFFIRMAECFRRNIPDKSFGSSTGLFTDDADVLLSLVTVQAEVSLLISAQGYFFFSKINNFHSEHILSLLIRDHCNNGPFVIMGNS